MTRDEQWCKSYDIHVEAGRLEFTTFTMRPTWWVWDALWIKTIPYGVVNHLGSLGLRLN